MEPTPATDSDAAAVSRGRPSSAGRRRSDRAGVHVRGQCCLRVGLLLEIGVMVRLSDVPRRYDGAAAVVRSTTLDQTGTCLQVFRLPMNQIAVRQTPYWRPSAVFDSHRANAARISGTCCSVSLARGCCDPRRGFIRPFPTASSAFNCASPRNR